MNKNLEEMWNSGEFKQPNHFIPGKSSPDEQLLQAIQLQAQSIASNCKTMLSHLKIFNLEQI